MNKIVQPIENSNLNGADTNKRKMRLNVTRAEQQQKSMRKKRRKKKKRNGNKSIDGFGYDFEALGAMISAREFIVISIQHSNQGKVAAQRTRHEETNKQQQHTKKR